VSTEMKPISVAKQKKGRRENFSSFLCLKVLVQKIQSCFTIKVVMILTTFTFTNTYSAAVSHFMTMTQTRV